MLKCLYCSECEPDFDPDGSPSEYCSDECRKKALNSGFTTPCIQCNEFPRVESSQFCGRVICRNAPKCNMTCMPKCLYCSECESDFDPDGNPSEYCSDE